MSIINEALKKTQQSRKMAKEKKQNKMDNQSASTTSTQGPAPTLKPEPVQKKPGPVKKSDFLFTWKMASILTVTALLVMMALTNYQRVITVNKPVLQAEIKPKDKMKVAFEGVFLTDSTTTALVNKQSMHVGDTLNGMKIVAIDQDTIDLQSDKGIIQLHAGATYLL